MNNLYGSAMSQKLPVNDFKWVAEFSEFNEDFIKISLKFMKVINDIFLKLYLIFWTLTWLSQWFTIFTWKNENWKV